MNCELEAITRKGQKPMRNNWVRQGLSCWVATRNMFLGLINSNPSCGTSFAQCSFARIPFAKGPFTNPRARQDQQLRRRFKSALPVALMLSLTALYFQSLGQEPHCRVRIALVDAATKKPVNGVIRCILEKTGQPVPISSLLSRGQGVGSIERVQGRPAPERSPIQDWYVLPSPSEILLPRQRIKLEAFSGLETERATVSLDLTGKTQDSLTLPVRFFSKIAEQSWYGGNTHLHLFGLTQPEADRYLKEIPRADQLDVLFTSYLVRPSEDRQYVTNNYPIGDLKDFWSTGVLINHGEEHRNNFAAFGQGYGHVMLLNIKRLIQPVSIGPGITGAGSDDIPLQHGIDEAHRQGGVAIWCHNSSGVERVPNFVTSKLDAQNIFDGNSEDRYQETFYHYLNAGLRVPFSTGTDWFLYDLSRVYTRVRGSLGIKSWLDALAAGRTFISNGPMLKFTVQGKEIGETLRLDSAREVEVHGRAVGRADFEKLEFIQNGEVVAEVNSRLEDSHYTAELNRNLKIQDPSWLAVRVSSGNKNEYGRQLFGHTSPIYIEVMGKSNRMLEEVNFLAREIEQARKVAATKAVFFSVEERQRVLAVYEKAADIFLRTPKPATTR